VLVAARAGRDTIEIEVACSDRHLPAEEVAGLFDPFPDSDGPASLTNGAGDRIQLATARALATVNGGTLGAESRASTGLVFTLRLPAASRAARRARGGRETATR
jgi:K+-sensing histidine kinase KdpD